MEVQSTSLVSMGVHLLKTRTDRGPQEVRRCCKVSQCEVGLGLKDSSLHMVLMLEPDIISSLKYVWPEKGDSSISQKQLNFKCAEVMLIIAMKSNVLHILTACVLSNECWWVIDIVCVLSPITAGWFMSGSRPAIFQVGFGAHSLFQRLFTSS